MWIWNKILASIISASVLSWASKCSADNEFTDPELSKDTIENVESKDIELKREDTLEILPTPKIQEKTQKEISICLETDDEDSFTHTKALEQVSDPKNTILEYPVAQLFQKYGEKSHPLRVPWVWRDFAALLWRNWIERLLSYTPQKLVPRSEEITSDTKYEIGDTLRFFLIDPLLKDDFPQYLSDQLKEEWFEEFSDPNASVISERIRRKTSHNSIKKKSDFIYDIVVKRVPSWKAALALYRDWELFMATYTSVWLRSRKTKTWQFKILDKNPYKRSHKYRNAAMPFALHFGNGFFFHQWDVTWYDVSHGCGRLFGVCADGLFNSAGKNIEHTDVFISKNLYNTEK